ncbi:anti-sigma factor [Paenibacillus terreus]|uniref:Anti-sigma factor n=1 Tax=Paenibacillus terreus TaxID=1387834 RepID=A0ABV5B248_9BACL
MKCREAKELFGVLNDLPEQDPRRKMVEDHSAHCERCSAEWSGWQLSRSAMLQISDEVTEEQAENVNRRVMERIYAESPWLVPGENRRSRISPALRKTISAWIAGFLAVFLCSFLVLTMSSSPAGKSFDHASIEAQQSGILPTGVAGSDSVSDSFKVVLPEPTYGIMEPLIGNIVPAYPQYWMVLSFLAVALALLSIGWVHRVRR